jgi:aldehyde dehydrogenase (NAD+)
VSDVQWERIQRLIEKAIGEGAALEVGGPGRPDGLDTGFYVRPTLFSNVTNDMTIAREEVFGPVLVMIGYDDVDDAVRIANDSDYGLSGYVSGPVDEAKAVARRLRTGTVHLNASRSDQRAPFGGFRMSGNGREWGAEGFEEFLEVKSVFGWA